MYDDERAGQRVGGGSASGWRAATSGGALRTCCVLRSKVAHSVRTTSSNAMAVIGRPPTVRFCPRGQARGEEAGAPGPGAPLITEHSRYRDSDCVHSHSFDVPSSTCFFWRCKPSNRKFLRAPRCFLLPAL